MTRAAAILALLAGVALYAEKTAPVTDPPRVLERFDPEYTPYAREARIEGMVLLRATLDESGKLRDIEVLKGVRHGLNGKAVECVNRWKFQPATRDGLPVAVEVNIEVNFRLSESVRLTPGRPDALTSVLQ